MGGCATPHRHRTTCGPVVFFSQGGRYSVDALLFSSGAHSTVYRTAQDTTSSISLISLPPPSHPLRAKNRKRIVGREKVTHAHFLDCFSQHTTRAGASGYNRRRSAGRTGPHRTDNPPPAPPSPSPSPSSQTDSTGRQLRDAKKPISRTPTRPCPSTVCVCVYGMPASLWRRAGRARATLCVRETCVSIHHCYTTLHYSTCASCRALLHREARPASQRHSPMKRGNGERGGQDKTAGRARSAQAAKLKLLALALGLPACLLFHHASTHPPAKENCVRVRRKVG